MLDVLVRMMLAKRACKLEALHTLDKSENRSIRPGLCSLLVLQAEVNEMNDLMSAGVLASLSGVGL